MSDSTKCICGRCKLVDNCPNKRDRFTFFSNACKQFDPIEGV